jgi:hypothetical protein
MFRRCISTLVLLGFVAGQLAAIPHAHGGCSPEEQREHDARPHVHVGFCGHSHDHDDSHDGHSHNRATDKVSPASGQQVFDDDGACNIEHDADAIYLPCVASPVAVKEQRITSGPGPISSTDLALDATGFRAELHYASVPIHPPNGHSSGAKLFLTLRNLRI